MLPRGGSDFRNSRRSQGITNRGDDASSGRRIHYGSRVRTSTVSPIRSQRFDWLELAVWLLPFAVVASSRLDVNDLAYQVRAGRLMWATGAILRQDVFTLTMNGEPWVNQQWGGQLVFGALFTILGWQGFVLLRAALVSLALAMTYRRTRRGGVGPLAAVGATIVPAFAAFALPGSLFLRPQLLALPLFVVVLTAIEGRHRHPSRTLLVVPITIIWANLHGSFLLVPMLLLIVTAVDIGRRRRSWRTDLALVIATVLAGCVTPWGTATYGYVVALASNDVVRLVAEWQPLWTHPAAAGVVAAVVVMTLVAAVRAPAAGDDVEGLVTMAVLVAVTVSSARFVVWWALFVPPIVASLFVRAWKGPELRREVARAAAIGLLAIATIAGVRAATESEERSLNDVPFGITQSLRERPAAARRVFNLWWGSWFEFSLPTSKMFTDTRLELFPGAIWRDYATVARADPRWDEILARWQISAVVIPADWDSPLMDAIRSSPRWTAIYEDEQGSLFVPT